MSAQEVQKTSFLGCQDQGATSRLVLLTVELNARLSGPTIGRKSGLYGNTGLTGLVLVCKGESFSGLAQGP